MSLSPEGERQRLEMAIATRNAANPDGLWNGARPRLAPPHTLQNRATGGSVSYPVYVLSVDNFERAEQALALCMAHGLLGPGR